MTTLLEVLVERGLAETRTKAQALVIAGKVFDDKGQRLDKPGMAIAADADYPAGAELSISYSLCVLPFACLSVCLLAFLPFCLSAFLPCLSAFLPFCLSATLMAFSL